MVDLDVYQGKIPQKNPAKSRIMNKAKRTPPKSGNLARRGERGHSFRIGPAGALAEA
jgi:hypothetical protein